MTSSIRTEIDRFTFGSLFAGIGGIDLGLERAGMECKWQVEIDEYCRRVLAKHWPHVERFGDIRDVGAGNLSPVDLIAGGFPCQDISNAGKRAGIDGEQSGLWAEYARVVRELRPRYVLVENVSALLRRGIDRVLGDLAEIGYDAEWECIPAAAVGAPHIRDRVFILAYSQREQLERGREPGELAGTARTRESQETERQRLWDAAGNCGEAVADTTVHRRRQRGQGRSHSGSEGQREPFRSIQAMADPDRKRCQEQRGTFSASPEQSATQCGGWWATEPDVGRVAHGVPAQVDRLRGLGNAVVPQVAEFIGRSILEAAS